MPRFLYLILFSLITTVIIVPTALSQEDLSLAINLDYADDSSSVLFSITPSTSDFCLLNFYAQQRKRRLKNVPKGAISIATFGYAGPVQIIAQNLKRIKKPSANKSSRPFRRNVYFRMMMRCDGEDGERIFSPIYRLRLRTTRKGGAKSVRKWILDAKYNMSYAD